MRYLESKPKCHLTVLQGAEDFGVTFRSLALGVVPSGRAAGTEGSLSSNALVACAFDLSTSGGC